MNHYRFLVHILFMYIPELFSITIFQISMATKIFIIIISTFVATSNTYVLVMINQNSHSYIIDILHDHD